MFERPFGQTNESAKKAEEILAGSGLSLESEDSQNRGQFVGKNKIEKSYDDVYKPNDEEKKVMEEKLEMSGLELEDKSNQDFGQHLRRNS